MKIKNIKKIALGILGFLGIFSSAFAATSVYYPYQGGTGTSITPIIGQVLVGQSNGTYAPQATSTLGISGGSGTNYFTNPGSGATTSLSTGTILNAPTGTFGTINATGTATSSVVNFSVQSLFAQALSLGSSAISYIQSLFTGTSPIVVTGGVISCNVASGSQPGCLASADWTTFNNKQPSGNYITALTGDVTASGPGSVAATLATVNSNTGSFGGASSIPSLTVNAKGLITAASANTPSIPVGDITGVLPFANGGTGTTSCPANDVFLSNGTIANCVATSSLGITGGGTNYFTNSGATTTLTTGTVLQSSLSSSTSFIAGVGSASIPSYSFNGTDAFSHNTGMYYSGGGSISFSALGNDVVDINANGIGSHINGSASTQSIYLYNVGGNTDGFYSPTTNTMGVAVNNTEVARFTTTSLGIGSTTPGSNLSVNGTAQITSTSTLTGLKITNLSNSILAVDPSGNVIATTTSAGDVTAVNASGGLQSSGGTTPNISPASGFIIPLSASTTQWNNFYNASGTFYLASNPAGYTSNTGTVTSVAQTVPTGLTVSGSPITTSGTLGLTYTSGYSIPLTASTTQGVNAQASTSALNGITPISYNPANGQIACATCNVSSANVSSVSNSDGTLTISPTMGAVMASLALSHANTWTGGQTFTNASATNLFASAATTTNSSSTNSFLGNLTLTNLSGTQCLHEISGVVSGTGSDCGSGGGGTNYLTNSGANTFLNTGTNLQALTFNATGTTATSTFAGSATFAGAVGIGTTTISGGDKLVLDNPTGSTWLALSACNNCGGNAFSTIDLGQTSAFTGISYNRLGQSLNIANNNNGYQFTLTNTGQVGIASGTPVATLAVGGSEYIAGTSTVTATSTLTGLKLTNLSNTFLAVDPSGNVIATTSTGGSGVTTITAGTGITLSSGSTCTSTCTISSTGGGSGNSAWTIENGGIYNATSTDRVSVGTSTLYAKLSVVETPGSTTPLFDVSSSTTGAATSSLFQVASNGNIGIGTNAPANLIQAKNGSNDLFDVISTGAHANSITLGGQTIADQLSSGIASLCSSGFSLCEISNSGSGFTTIGPSGEYSGSASTQLSSAGTSYVTLMTQNSLSQTADTEEWLDNSNNKLDVINSAGMFGLGTSTPNTELSVTGTTTTTGLKILNLSNTILAVDSSGNVIATTTSGGGGTNYWSNSGATTTLSTGSIAVANAVVATSSLTVGTTTTSAFYVGTNGNVGIGTTTPGSILTVVGTSLFTGAEVNQSTLSVAATSTLTGLKLTNLSNTFLAVDPSGNVIATTTPSGGGGSGTVSSGTAGQVAVYNTSGTAVSGTSTINISSTGTTTIGGPLALGGSNGVTILSNGDMGIGGDVSPTFPLSAVDPSYPSYGNFDIQRITSGFPNVSVGYGLVFNSGTTPVGAIYTSNSGSFEIANGNGSLGLGSYGGGGLEVSASQFYGTQSDTNGFGTGYLNDFQVSQVSGKEGGLTGDASSSLYLTTDRLARFTVQEGTGFVGIGTTSPRSLLAVQGYTGSTSPLLTLASSTGAIQFQVGSNGHIHIGGSIPSVSCLGTCNLDVNSSDGLGSIAISGVQTSVTLNFTKLYGDVVCMVNDSSTSGNYEPTATSTTSVTFSTAVSLGTAQIYYQCTDMKKD